MKNYLTYIIFVSNPSQGLPVFCVSPSGHCYSPVFVSDPELDIDVQQANREFMERSEVTYPTLETEVMTLWLAIQIG